MTERAPTPTSSKVLVTGSSGFIGGYVVEELLGRGYAVVGRRQPLEVRAGREVVRRPPELHARRGRLPRRRAHDRSCSMDCDHFIAGAALIGGISYFHTFAYDLLATNERIMASSCDAAIEPRTATVGSRRSPT